MAIEVIPLSRLQSETSGVLARCCDSGSPVVVELPDHRFVAIHPLDSDDESDSLVSELLETCEEFRVLLKKSLDSPRQRFVPGE
jgi:hypothetical protein